MSHLGSRGAKNLDLEPDAIWWHKFMPMQPMPHPAWNEEHGFSYCRVPVDQATDPYIINLEIPHDSKTKWITLHEGEFRQFHQLELVERDAYLRWVKSGRKFVMPPQYMLLYLCALERRILGDCKDLKWVMSEAIRLHYLCLDFSTRWNNRQYRQRSLWFIQFLAMRFNMGFSPEAILIICEEFKVGRYTFSATIRSRCVCELKKHLNKWPRYLMSNKNFPVQMDDRYEPLNTSLGKETFERIPEECFFGVISPLWSAANKAARTRL